MQAQCERSCSQEKHVGPRGLDKKREPSTQIVINGTQLKFRRRIIKYRGESGSVVSTDFLVEDH